MTTSDKLPYAQSEHQIPVTPTEWNHRFSESPDEWYFGREPSELARLTYIFWKTFLPDIPPTVLDFGCGEGRDSVFFAQNEFEVSAIDGSAVALEKLSRLAHEMGVTINSIQESELNASQVTNEFSIVCAHNSLQFLGSKLPSTISHMKSVALPGTFHAISAFSDEADVTRDYPGLYRLTRGELKLMYQDWFVLYYSEEMIWRENSQNFFSFAKIIAHKP